MGKNKLIGLLFGAWNDLDRVVDGLDPAEAVQQSDGGSSYAWTVAHLANQVDTWANVRIGRKNPHDYMSQERFRFGGTGSADDWQTILKAAREVREAARGYLEAMEDADLDTVVPYEGSIARLRETGINLRYTLIRMCATTTSTSVRSPPSGTSRDSGSATIPVCWKSACRRSRHSLRENIPVRSSSNKGGILCPESSSTRAVSTSPPATPTS